MKRHWMGSKGVGLLILVIGLVLLAALPPAQAGELVETEGVAAIVGGNRGAARERAIDDGLRRAVEQVAGTIVSSSSLTESFKIVHDQVLVRAAGYIEKYTILSESQEGEMLKVRIRAEVGKGNLLNDYCALSMLHVLKGKPKIMILIDEGMGELLVLPPWEKVGQAESTLAEKMLKTGFNLVDPQTARRNISRDQALRMLEGDANAAKAEGLKYGAQYVVTGKAFARSAGALAGTAMKSMQAVLQVRGVETDTGKIVSSRSARATALHIDELQGAALSIKKATEALFDELLADFIRYWNQGVTGAQEITLMISGVTWERLSTIRRVLERETQGVKAVHQRGFTGSVAELGLDYRGKSSGLADELAARKFSGFRLEPTNVTPNRVDVKVIGVSGQ